MAGYAVTNWTKKHTAGIYGSEDAARTAMPEVLEVGDEYSVIAMPAGTVGVGEELEAGTYTG